MYKVQQKLIDSLCEIALAAEMRHITQLLRNPIHQSTQKLTLVRSPDNSKARLLAFVLFDCDLKEAVNLVRVSIGGAAAAAAAVNLLAALVLSFLPFPSRSELRVPTRTKKLTNSWSAAS